MDKILVVAGTRPEFIKLSPVILALDRREIPYDFLRIGQHKDYEMSSLFIQELKIPLEESRTLPIISETPAAQTADVMRGIERSILELKPSLVIVQGDTNTTLAAAIAAVKQGVDVAHVEAGLRSYDWRTPEEHNRRIVDHISSLLFAPTRRAERNLFRENVMGERFVTGNTAIDSVISYLPEAQLCSKIMDEIRFDEYFLATFHRAENVDNPKFLVELLEVMRELPLPVVFPVHPRTLKRFREYGLHRSLEELSHQVQVLPPLGYLDFLVAMKNCRLLLTDSGGIQEESTAPGIKKIAAVVRESTERPEALEAGFAVLSGVSKEKILESVSTCLEMPTPPAPSPFGDGKAGKRIALILEGILLGAQQEAFEPLIHLGPERIAGIQRVIDKEEDRTWPAS